MATMKDVAALADVSITTVSHVINETRFVSDELRTRVLEAMEELRYRPNMLARSLRLGETRTIGLIVPDNANPFFAQVARVVEDAGFDAGYSVILCNCDGKVEKERAYVGVLSAKQVDGIIFMATGGEVEIVDLLREIGIPLVMADRRLDNADVDIVLVDNFRGGYEATKYLVSLGHRRIGCITGPSDATPSAERVQGYRRGLEEAGIPVDESLIVRGDFQYRGGEEGIERLLALEEAPTAVFACNDLMAMGVMTALRKSGLRVPGDVSVIGFDDIPEACVTVPPLATVAQPIDQIGRVATEMLLERIASKESPGSRTMVLDVEVVKRESCGPRRQS